ncbi:protein translocase membrane subunit [Lasius niger]|uniref:Protein translocase membrane subunit n=1 Tax=Lasius niger TaxID=67767 RepID=A0A0J7KGM0_LASNI|nr:protein translocase membrane subunit [Lasius niger]
MSQLPWRQIHLGLDLKGGSYLLMQLDTASLEKDQLHALREQLKQSLLAKGAGYVNLLAIESKNEISFSLRAPKEHDIVVATLNKLIITNDHVFAYKENNGRFVLSFEKEAFDSKAKEAVSRAIEIVRRRIDETGAMDPTIAREGDNRIMVELPGVSDPERIKTLLGTTARLTFRLVAEPNESFGTALLTDEQTGQQIPIRDHIAVDGADLTNAGASIDQQGGGWAVTFQLNSKGADAFAAVTQANVGKRFAIVLDQKVIEAPRIMSPITGGNGQITGGFTSQSASDLALLLRAGALPAPLKIIEERSIGPSLGKASIHAGITSLGVGFLLVTLFMVIFYGQFGIYADISLLANLGLMLGILSLFQATLTLAGMAGILLTLGMALDANILINARIREETQKGKPPLQAIQSGFVHAKATVIDSNVTAFLAHVMLFIFGAGPVRNFALTITIGIGTTLFTTLLLTPLLIMRWYSRTRPKKLPV